MTDSMIEIMARERRGAQGRLKKGPPANWQASVKEPLLRTPRVAAQGKGLPLRAV
jgi:hypothetical protein